MKVFPLALTGAFLAACSFPTTDHSVADFVANPMHEQEALSIVAAFSPDQGNDRRRFIAGDDCTEQYSDLTVRLYDVDGDYVVYVEDIFNSSNCLKFLSFIVS